MRKIKILITVLCMMLALIAQAIAAPAPEKIILEKNHSTYLDLWGLDSVAVGNPEIADITVVSSREILIVAKGQGSTSLQVKFKSGNRRSYAIVVTDNDREVAESMESILNYPNVVVSKVGDNIVLDGYVENQIEKKRAETIAKMYGKNVVNLLEMENPKQIKIEAKIVEVNSDKIDKIGLQYFNAVDVKKDKDTNTVSFKPGNTGIFQMGQNYGKGAYGWFGDYAGINANLNLLVTQGFAKVLSQPNVVTMSGEKANILIGGEIPLPVSNSDGQISVEWREYGIKLAIEPNAGIEDKITGKINAEVSTLDSSSAAAINLSNGLSIPALRSRKAETVITLNSGNTMAIGGLITSDDSKQITKVPILGDLPILGNFFRSTVKNKERKEIIILVTPTLIDETYQTPMSHKMKTYINDKIEEEKTLAKSPEQLKEEQEKIKADKVAEEKAKIEADKAAKEKIKADRVAEEKAKIEADKAAKEKIKADKTAKEKAKLEAEKAKKEQQNLKQQNIVETDKNDEKKIVADKKIANPKNNDKVTVQTASATKPYLEKQISEKVSADKK